MLPEFRYEGVDSDGRIVQGALHAKNQREASERAKDIGKSRRFRIASIQRKVTWSYKVQRGAEKPIVGVQRAFSKEEVEGAFRKLGFRVLSIRRKLVDLQMRPAKKDVALFIRMCSDLLRQGLTYDEILKLQGTDAQDPVLRQTVRQIAIDLRDGKEGEAVYEKHADVFGRFAAHMLALASKSGRMAEIYEQAARFLERNEEFRKSMRSALIMPLLVFLALIVSCLFYVAYVFPKTAELFTKYDVDIPPMTAKTLAVSGFVQGNLVWILVVLAVASVGFLRWVATPKGREMKDRWSLKIPVIGSLLHKTSTEIFCRVFHSMYQGSGDNIDAIRMAAEACQNKWMERRIVEVALPLMTQEGFSLVEALRRAGVFHKTVLYRLHSGAESGTLRASLVQVADYFETETSYRLKGVVDMVQVSIAIVVTLVMTALTFISAESAVVQPKMPGMIG